MNKIIQAQSQSQSQSQWDLTGYILKNKTSRSHRNDRKIKN